MSDPTHLASAPPVVLALSALDPAGRGGIQADIEASASLFCHCAPIATALCTCGDSMDSEVLAVDSALLIHQARSLLEDIEVNCIKIGFLASVSNAEAIHAILNDYPNIPVIMQPSFALLDDANTEQMELVASLSNLILPYSDLVIASIEEARLLSSSNDTLEATAQALLDEGPSSVLLCTADLKRRRYEYKLFDERERCRLYGWKEDKNSPLSFGNECTFAAAMAALIAHGSPHDTACERAIAYAEKAAAHSWQLGFEKPTPNRFFWANGAKKMKSTSGGP